MSPKGQVEDQLRKPKQGFPCSLRGLLRNDAEASDSWLGSRVRLLEFMLSVFLRFAQNT